MGERCKNFHVVGCLDWRWTIFFLHPLTDIQWQRRRCLDIGSLMQCYNGNWNLNQNSENNDFFPGNWERRVGFWKQKLNCNRKYFVRTKLCFEIVFTNEICSLLMQWWKLVLEMAKLLRATKFNCQPITTWRRLSHHHHHLLVHPLLCWMLMPVLHKFLARLMSNGARIWTAKCQHQAWHCSTTAAQIYGRIKRIFSQKLIVVLGRNDTSFLQHPQASNWCMLSRHPLRNTFLVWITGK